MLLLNLNKNYFKIKEIKLIPRRGKKE